jgi:hypothetical protein
MRAASPLLATPGGKPRKPRVSAGHPDESGCGAHECARHELPSHPHAGIRSRFLRERPPAPGIFIGFRGPKAQDQQGRKYTRRQPLPVNPRQNRGAVVAYALMRAASPLLATPGGKPRKPRVSAGHPDESGCGAHECALDELPSHPHAESLSRLGKDPSPASPRNFHRLSRAKGPGPTGSKIHPPATAPCESTTESGCRCGVRTHACRVATLGDARRKTSETAGVSRASR